MPMLHSAIAVVLDIMHTAHCTLTRSLLGTVGGMGIEFLHIVKICIAWPMLKSISRLRLLVGKKERVNEKYDKSSESKSETMLLTRKQLLSDDVYKMLKSCDETNGSYTMFPLSLAAYNKIPCFNQSKPIPSQPRPIPTILLLGVKFLPI